VVLLTVAGLLALAAWWALRAVPHEETVPLATTVSAPASSAQAAGETPDSGTPPSPTPRGGVPVSKPAGEQLVVDVAGKVRRPGIIELPAGSRVIDAVTAAGGVRPGIDTAGLNLARLLVDGEQIVVGLAVPAVPAGAPPATGSTTSTMPAIVDINTADQTELETLPGIGPVTAQAILEWRAENGAFATVDQLLDVSGIGDATLSDLEPYVRV
jgi:competence protein ComEA